MAHDSQTSSWVIVSLAKDKASGTNQMIKALRQGRHWVCGLTHRRAIKEETIAINHDWVYSQICRLSHDNHAIPSIHITFDNLFDLITKIRVFNNSFEFINKITINTGSDMPCYM